MDVNKEYVYFRSKVSGLVLTLPGDLPMVRFNPTMPKPGEPGTPGKPQYGLAMVDKKDKELLDAIKKHPRFGKVFFKVKTPAELAEEERLAKCAEFAAKIMESVNSGAVALNLDQLKKDELFDFANKIGVSVKKGEKDRKMSDVIDECYQKLGIYPAPVEEEQPPELPDEEDK